MKRIWFALCICLFVGAINCNKDESINGDNDFADFEDFDSDDDFISVSDDIGTNQNNNVRDNVASDNEHQFQGDDDEDGLENDEFDHFTDEEEFEGFNKESSSVPVLDTKTGEPKLTVAKVPLHFG